MRVMSANVRNADRCDDGHSWEHRKASVRTVIANCEPDLLGLQEATNAQVETIAAALPDHSWHGVTQAPNDHPRNALLVRNSLDIVESGGYWLSPTPQIAGSIGWDAKYPRHANWLVVADTNGTQWRIVNTHLDHEGPAARSQAAQLLAADGAAWPSHMRQLLVGDLNTGTGTEPIRTLERSGWRDTWAAAHPTDTDPGPTRHGFGVPADSHPQRIDWIMARGPVHVVSSELVHDRPDGVWPSDHFFIWADVIANV